MAKWALLILLGATALVGGAIQAARGSVQAPHVVINEVDYDNVGNDTREFVELFNGTGAAVDLGNYAVAFVNGLDGTEYLRVALGGNCLAPGQYLVVMDPAVQPAPGGAHRPVSGCDEPGAERRAGRPRVDRRRNVDRRGCPFLRGSDHVGAPRRLSWTGQPRRGEPDRSRGLERERGLDGS